MINGRSLILLLVWPLLLAACSMFPAAENRPAPTVTADSAAARPAATAVPSPLPSSPEAVAADEPVAGLLPTLAPRFVPPEEERCTDQTTGKHLSYREAQVIARDSACAEAGELLPAHLCNAATGTWWLSLKAPQEGCNPACVVNVNDGTAEIDWRCTGPAGPPAESEIATAAPDFEAFTGWRGTVQRLAPGGQVEYQFQRDDGQAFFIAARDTAVRVAITSAAWNGTAVALSGSMTAVPGLLNVDSLDPLGEPSAEARNLTPFASPGASSALPDDVGGSYVAWSAIDGEIAQPWCEGVEGPGVGEWLQLDFSAPVAVTAIELANGFDGDGQLFFLNNRVQTATFHFDNGVTVTANLEDAFGLQSIPLVAGSEPGIVTTSIRLVIDEIYPGWTYDDTCLGELVVWALPAAP